MTHQIIKIPECWSDITVRNYLKFKGTSDILQQIAFLCGLDFYDKDVMTLTHRDVRNIKLSLKWMEKVPLKVPNELEVNGVLYKKKPLNTMSVFEWRTYDYYTRDVNDNYVNHLIATMFQKEGENWGYDLNERAELFLDVPMSYWGVNEFVEFKKLCFEKYPLAEETKHEEPIENETYQEKARRLEAERKQLIANTLNWEKIMLTLSNNSIKESYEAMHLPILYIFRIITLLKE